MINGFSVEVEQRHQVLFVIVKGEIDVYTCPSLRKALDGALSSETKNVVINLENTQYIDSTGLGTIAHTARNLESEGGFVYVVCNKPQIRKIFEVSGLQDKNVRIFETEDDVVSELV